MAHVVSVKLIDINDQCLCTIPRFPKHIETIKSGKDNMNEFDVRIEIDAENDCFYLTFEGERIARIVIPEGQSLSCEELLEIVNDCRRTLKVGYELGKK